MDHQKTQSRLEFRRLLFSFFFIFSAIYAEAPPTAENLKKLDKVLKAHPGDYTERIIKRLGNNTIGFEVFISTEADWVLLKRIIPDWAAYPNWAIRNINDRPTGGKYYVQIKGLKVDPSTPGIWDADMALKLPALSLSIQRKFNVSITQAEGVVTLFVESLPHDFSPVKGMSGYVQFFDLGKAGGRAGVYAKGSVVLRNWLLYESLPDRVLSREGGERVQILLDNYQHEESRLRQSLGK